MDIIIGYTKTSYNKYKEQRFELSKHNYGVDVVADKPICTRHGTSINITNQEIYNFLHLMSFGVTTW